MVDLHLHILPGLDDGAEDLETAVRMAKMAAHSGVFHMAATSHGNYYDYTLEEYRESFERLQRELVIRQISYGASETVPCEFYGTGGEGDEIGYGTSGQPLSESYG